MHLAMVFVKRERSEERTLCLRPEEMHVTSGDTQDFSDADQIGEDAVPKPSSFFWVGMLFNCHTFSPVRASSSFQLNGAFIENVERC